MDLSSVLGAIKTGGFQNPISDAVSGKLATLPNVKTMLPAEFNAYLTSLATGQSVAYGGAMPTPDKIIELQTSLTNAINKMGDLVGHTNRISGVDLTGTGTLATIAKTMNSAKNINGEKSCSTVLKAFGSLMKASELINDTLDTIALIEAIIADIPNQIANAKFHLDNYVNKIAQQLVDDVEALAQAKLDVLHNAIASAMVDMIHDECISQVLGGVMTQPLRNEVTKASDLLRSQKLISIGKIR